MRVIIYHFRSIGVSFYGISFLFNYYSNAIIDMGVHMIWDFFPSNFFKQLLFSLSAFKRHITHIRPTGGEAVREAGC